MEYIKNMKALNGLHNQICTNSNQPSSMGFPEELTLTTTLKCNYRCRMCYQTEYKSVMDWAVVERVAGVLPFVKTLQIFGGEPLLYSRVTELYELAHANQCGITMISNGSLLSEEMCRSIVENFVLHIKFSMDAGTPATYKKIRGGDFFKVVKGVQTITKMKARIGSPLPDMHFNFLIMRSNVKELSRLIAIAAESGVSTINCFYPSMHNEELVKDCVFFDQEYSDRNLAIAREVAKKLGVGLNLPPLFSECPEGDEKLNSTKVCTDPWTKFLIDVDGTVSPCCGGFGRIGNILESDFQTIWNSERVRKLRAKVNTPEEPACCRNCRVRKPVPSEIRLHIGDKALQEYASEYFKANPVKS